MISVRRVWPCTLTLTSQKLFGTDAEDLCQISPKSNSNISKYHNERNKLTNERTNQPTNRQTALIPRDVNEARNIRDQGRGHKVEAKAKAEAKVD